ncbi:MAG: MaoC family dehydratase [Saprospiraceae bacterium]|nr:MaoC family dehydratase [Saprospiraceae bacterium]
MRIIENYQELETRVGEMLTSSSWHTVTQEQVNQFANLTGDRQWIHVDVEKARKLSPYKGPIAHGFFVLSLLSKFFFESIEIRGISLSINYGLNKVRFTNAVPVGSRIRAQISVIDYKEIQQGARVFYRVVVEIEGVEKPACVAETISQIHTGGN